MQTITVPSASGSGIAGYPNSDYDTQGRVSGVKKYTRNPIRYPIIFKKKKSKMIFQIQFQESD